MGKVSTLQESKLTLAEDNLAWLGRTRHKDIPELLIRIEAELEYSGNKSLLEPALELLRAMDERMAKMQDNEIALYEIVGGKART